MADRKSVLKAPPPRPELDRLLAEARDRTISDEDLAEQRISFVYGNAPTDSTITRESARRAAGHIRLKE